MTSGYHPLVPANDDYYERRLRELERQVKELQAGRKLSAASFRGGAFRFLDDAGQPRLTLGTITPVGAVGDPSEPYGNFVFGDGGAIVHAAREGDRGLTFPPEPMPWRKFDEKVVINATSFTNCWQASAYWPNQEVVHFGTYISLPSSFTAEVRLRDGYSGATTAVASLTAGASPNQQYLEFFWLHPSLVGLNDPRGSKVQGLDVLVQARRVSGTGDVWVLEPNVFQLESKWLQEGNYATDGNPTWSPSPN
jgi:hypothetical protein